MYRVLLICFFISSGVIATEQQRPFNIITLKNDLERPVEIEAKQENLELKVGKPVVGEKGKIDLVPLKENTIIILPKNTLTIQFNIRGEAKRGQVIAHAVPDKRITLFGYEVEAPSKRTPESQKTPAVCQLDKPGTDDVALKITTGRLSPLACKPLNPKVL